MLSDRGDLVEGPYAMDDHLPTRWRRREESVLPSGLFEAPQWTDVLFELEHALVWLIEVADAFLVINVSRADDVFVQYHTCRSGTITAEAAATRRCGPNCATRHLLSRVEHAALASLGWRPPNLDPLRLAAPGTGHANFYRQWSTYGGWPAALFSDLTVRTLWEVWGLSPAECRLRAGLLPTGSPPEML